MKIIHNKEKIRNAMEELGIDKIMDCQAVTFVIHEFEKGELISSPGKIQRYLRFLISGDVQVYGISEESAMVRLSLVERGSIVGDAEFVNSGATLFFAEAMEKACFLAVDMVRYHDELHSDVLLLNYIMGGMLQKMQRSASSRVENQTLEERVIRYLRYQSEDHMIHGIEKSLPVLQCSRRNLQRVLRRLSEHEVITREKKGQYRLTDNLT